MKVSIFFVLGLTIAVSSQGSRESEDAGAGEDGRSICDIGRSQSPIAIVLNETIRVQYDQPGLLLFGYDRPIENVVLENDGITARVIIPCEAGLAITGPHLNWKLYTLQQFHFHWDYQSDDCGSEHTLDGMEYQLELHLVHKSADEQTAVIGILFQLANASGTQNGALDTLTSYFDLIINGPTNVTMDTPFNVTDLLPSYKDTFVYYTGSLTTPPCTENTEWTVFPEVQYVTKEQLQSFRKLINGTSGQPAGSHRRPQPLNGRKVFLYSPAEVSSASPAISSLLFTLACASFAVWRLWL